MGRVYKKKMEKEDEEETVSTAHVVWYRWSCGCCSSEIAGSSFLFIIIIIIFDH